LQSAPCSERSPTIYERECKRENGRERMYLLTREESMEAQDYEEEEKRGSRKIKLGCLFLMPQEILRG